jgi:hypothetical protein
MDRHSAFGKHGTPITNSLSDIGNGLHGLGLGQDLGRSHGTRRNGLILGEDSIISRTVPSFISRMARQEFALLAAA